MARSKVNSRSQHDFEHLHPPNQCPYHVSTSYTLWFLGYSPDKVLKVKVTMARSKVKSRVPPWHCTPTPPDQCPYQVSTSYTLGFLRYSLDKLFPTARTPFMGENNTPTALKGCGVKMKRKVPVGGFTGLQQLEIKVMPLYLGPVSRSLLCFFFFP